MAPPIVKDYGQTLLRSMADAARAKRMPAVIPTPPYLGRGAGNPTVSNRVPIPGAQPGGGGGALVRQGGRDLVSLGERGMRSIGGGATPGATAARVGRGVGAAAGPFTAGAPISGLLGAGAGAETATGLGGLLRGLAGRAAGAAGSLPFLMGTMTGTPHGFGDGTDSGRLDPMNADIDLTQEDREGDRIGYSDPIAMSHAPEFSGVGGEGAMGYNGIGQDGEVMIRGLMRAQMSVDGQPIAVRTEEPLNRPFRPGGGIPGVNMTTPESQLYNLTKSATGENPTAAMGAALTQAFPRAAAGPQVRGASPALAGPRGSSDPRQVLATAPLFQEDDEIKLDESKFADVPMNGQAPVAELPPIPPRGSGSEIPGMEALLAGLKKKREPMGGPILTGGSSRQSIRLGGNVLSR